MSFQSRLVLLALVYCHNPFSVDALAPTPFFATKGGFAIGSIHRQHQAGTFLSRCGRSTMSKPHSLSRRSDAASTHRAANTNRRTTSISLSFLSLAETLAPRIGIFTSTGLYCSPAVAVLAAIRTGDLADLNPLPLGIMSISAIAWLVYGLSIQDPYVILSNIVGCIASISYVVGILPLIKERKQLRSTQIVVISGAASLLCLWTYLALLAASNNGMPWTKISSYLGLFASGLFCILSASPLSTIRSVIRTKNSSSILGPFTAAQVTNCALWSAYGLAAKNKFVWGPNVIGLGLGFAQLALKLLFPSSKKT
jgi:solute carrier family 50 protein (sugar transporter)